jgi:hypothetical protein
MRLAPHLPAVYCLDQEDRIVPIGRGGGGNVCCSNSNKSTNNNNNMNTEINSTYYYLKKTKKQNALLASGIVNRAQAQVFTLGGGGIE